MYASVYDAAVTVGMALTNVIAGSDDRTQISLTRVSNATCALRRASTQHKGPGWKLLQHIREVPFSKGLQSTLSKMDIAGTGTKCQSANNGSTERQGQTLDVRFTKAVCLMEVSVKGELTVYCPSYCGHGGA